MEEMRTEAYKRLEKRTIRVVTFHGKVFTLFNYQDGTYGTDFSRYYESKEFLSAEAVVDLVFRKVHGLADVVIGINQGGLV